MNVCLNCGREAKNKFCSRSCSASYNNRLRSPRTEESRLRTAKNVKRTVEERYSHEYLSERTRKSWKIPNRKVARRIRKYCLVCNKELCSTNCSGLCKDHYILTDEFQKHIGSYSRRFAKGKVYNKWTNTWVFLHSGMEFRYFYYLTTSGIKWEKPKSLFYSVNGKARRYFSDFFLTDESMYIELKGYFWPNDKEKMKLVIEQNKDKNIKILVEKDIPKVPENYMNSLFSLGLLEDKVKPIYILSKEEKETIRREKIRKYRLGRKQKDETKEKIRQFNLGRRKRL